MLSLTNSADPDQMPHSEASDVGLFCLPKSQLWEGTCKHKRLIAKLTWSAVLCSNCSCLFVCMIRYNPVKTVNEQYI